MPQQVSIEKIELFRKGIAFLKEKRISRSTIGDKMPGVGKANFSKYYNGKLPITEEFLAKFYQVWGNHLQSGVESKNTNYWTEITDNESAEEGKTQFRIKDTIVEKLLEAQNQLVKSNTILAESNRILMENNRRLVDLLIQQGVKPGGA